MIAEFRDWRAEHIDDTNLRVRADLTFSDQFWMENHGGNVSCELDYGRDGLRGPATLESTEPLVLVFDTGGA